MHPIIIMALFIIIVWLLTTLVTVFVRGMIDIFHLQPLVYLIASFISAFVEKFKIFSQLLPANVWFTLLIILYIVIGVIYIFSLHHGLERQMKKWFRVTEALIAIVLFAFFLAPDSPSPPNGINAQVLLVWLGYGFSIHIFIVLLINLTRSAWKLLKSLPFVGILHKNSLFVQAIGTVGVGLVLYNWITWVFSTDHGIGVTSDGAFSLLSLFLIPVGIFIFIRLLIDFLGGLKNELQIQINKIQLEKPPKKENAEYRRREPEHVTNNKGNTGTSLKR